MSKMLVVVGGYVKEVENVHLYGYLPVIECDDNTEYYVVEDRQDAVDAVVKYWEDMIDNDPKELRCLVGDDCLIQWAMGHSAGPGDIQADSLTDWVEAISEYPEEQWATYDGEEREGKINYNLMYELGFDQRDVILYRAN